MEVFSNYSQGADEKYGENAHAFYPPENSVPGMLYLESLSIITYPIPFFPFVEVTPSSPPP